MYAFELQHAPKAFTEGIAEYYQLNPVWSQAAARRKKHRNSSGATMLRM
jgi:hypothetical protein